MQEDYAAFLESRAQQGAQSGFDPIWMPGFLKDFQTYLVEWSIRMGRSALLRLMAIEREP